MALQKEEKNIKVGKTFRSSEMSKADFALIQFVLCPISLLWLKLHWKKQMYVLTVYVHSTDLGTRWEFEMFLLLIYRRKL